ncbi:MAG TPA: hypothetical protein VM432_08370 [Bdellovibrionales bacterium]|nr:hypothetical protein [Bdellovibrionales bacterium]
MTRSILFLTFASLVGFVSTANASGCGDTYSIYFHERNVVKEVTDFSVVARNAKSVTIKLGNGTKLELQKLVGAGPQVLEPTRLYQVDVSFYEGNDCGPAVNCVTGQYLLAKDPQQPGAGDFAFPAVENEQYYSGPDAPWFSDKSLLPTSTPMEPFNDDKEPIPVENPQCLLGHW